MKHAMEDHIESSNMLLMVFRLDEQRYALPIAVVERIVRAVEITPLPGAPAVVLGVIDVRGRVSPVLDMRQRFGLAQREINSDDEFVLAHIAGLAVALVIDEAQGVIEHPTKEIVSSAQIAPGVTHIQGVVNLDDGLVLINDLEKFLSLDEAHALDKALVQEATYDA